MKKIVLLFIGCLLLAFNSSAMSPAFLQGVVGNSECSGHNCGLDTDGDLYARWLFENDLTDDGDNSEDLTDGNNIAFGTTSPGPKEGTYRSYFDGTGDYAYRDDGDLNSGFPFKYGQSNTTISVAGWVDFDTNPADGSGYTIFSKYNSTGDYRSMFMALYNDGGTIKWRLNAGKTSGTAADIYYHGSTNPSSDTWYFVCFSIDASNIYIKIRDASGNTVGTDYSTSLLNTVSIEDVMIEVGAFGGSTWKWDGWIDELLVFDRVLSAADVTDLAEGDYK